MYRDGIQFVYQQTGGINWISCKQLKFFSVSTVSEDSLPQRLDSCTNKLIYALAVRTIGNHGLNLQYQHGDDW